MCRSFFLEGKRDIVSFVGAGTAEMLPPTDLPRARAISIYSTSHPRLSARKNTILRDLLKYRKFDPR